VYPRAFSYIRARSQDEAVSALAEHGSEAAVLAGGMSLVPQMKYRERTPAVVIDVGRIRELAGITATDGSLRIGATTRHHEAEAWRGGTQLAIVSELAAGIGDPQVRNMGTVGGNVAAVEPAGDWGPALLALRGAVRVVSATGERTISADDLFVAPRRPALDPDELIVEVSAHLPAGRFGTAQVRFEARAAAAAFMNCSACVALDRAGVITEVGIGCGGLEDVPVRIDDAEVMLRGAEPSPATIDAAASVLTTRPAAGGSNGFRRAVAARLVRDALQMAVARATATAQEGADG
jgi:carbon-monoxide dehydrogenase medium subunit